MQGFARPGGGGGQHAQMQHVQVQRMDRHGGGMKQADRGQRVRNFDRQQARGNQMRMQPRMVERQQMHGNQMRQAQNRSIRTPADARRVDRAGSH